MHETAALTTILGLLALASPTRAADYEIDGSHSHVGFSVRHMMVSSTRGEFGEVTGTVRLDEADLTRSKIEATIQAGSIDTRDAKRDQHLRSPDFFAVEQYPTITFRSTRIRRAGRSYLVTGDLTIRGVTRQVTLTASAPTPDVKDPWGGVRRGLTATAKLNRKDFGIRWNKTLDGGGLVVGDEVQVQLDIELTRKQPATAAR
jgi:polyisoprenoid-binding protein YceI